MPSYRTSICLLLLTLFWGVIYLPALAKRELQGEEARRVLPGRTMMQTGEWFVPRSGGEVYNRKPPLVNWMSAAAISLTGHMDEWTVRTPATLLMLALGLSVFLFLRGWLGNTGAMLAALITLTNIGFIEKGRIIEIEALYMSLFGIALVAWLGLRWQGREWLSWIVSGLVLGLGFLAKGPLHMVYFYAIVIGVLHSERRLRDLAKGPHIAGLLCFFAVWTPWAMINSARNPMKDSGKVWADQITHRLGFVEFNFANYLLQIPQSLVNFLPWALLLPLCWKLHSTGTNRHSQWMRGIGKGLFWSFVFIAVLPSSRPRFMLPLNVAAAILVADAMLRFSADRVLNGKPAWHRMLIIAGVISAALFTALALFGGTAAILAAPFLKGAWLSWHWAAWALCIAAAVLGWLWIARLDFHRIGALAPAAAAGLGLAICGFAFCTINRNPWQNELRDFGANLTTHAGNSAPILLYKVGERMWPFYLGMRCHETALMKDRPDGIAFHWIVTPERVWRKKDEQEAVEFYYGKTIAATPIKAPEGMYVLVQTAE